MHIRFTHLDYIGLYYRILNEILECNYNRSFVGFSFFLLLFFTSIVILHSPANGWCRPISEREKENREKLR